MIDVRLRQQRPQMKARSQKCVLLDLKARSGEMTLNFHEVSAASILTEMQ